MYGLLNLYEFCSHTNIEETKTGHAISTNKRKTVGGIVPHNDTVRIPILHSIEIVYPAVLLRFEFYTHQIYTI